MEFERGEDGEWSVLAPWLSEPVTAATYEDAYWEAVRLRRPPSAEIE